MTDSRPISSPRVAARVYAQLCVPLCVLLAAACADPTRPADVRAASLDAARATAPAIAATSVIAPLYVADFVSTAATGASMNDNGDIVGTSYTDPGCGPFCLPPQETVVWRGAGRTVLPALATGTPYYVRMINNSGWIVGLSGTPGTATKAVVWRPSGTGYAATDLGTLSKRAVSEATGIDQAGRVVGFSRTLYFPPTGSPFAWSASTGLVDLAPLGYPSEDPLAISPGGRVATASYTYQLGNLASVTRQPAPPSGYYAGNWPVVVNDNGDLARFLITVSSQNLAYPFRLPAGGTWQQISTTYSGSRTPFGFGTINNARDVTLTILGGGAVAIGPGGTAQSLSSRVAASYQGATVTRAGTLNASGQIMASLFIGRSARLVRLTPAKPCTTNCARSAAVALTGRFVQDRRYPGSCFQGGTMYNAITASVTARNESGAALSGATVAVRILDDYWTSRLLTATTNTSGVASFSTRTPCGVGTVALLVDRITAGTRAFDRTAGVMTASVIPQ